MHALLKSTAGFLLLALAATALALAGSTESSSRAAETIERGAGLAGTLNAIPGEVRRGARIGAAVRNTGEHGMAYGLGFGVHRRVGGEWGRVPDPFTTDSVPDIGLKVRPGESAGPRYGRLVDRFRLRQRVQPGNYRLVKVVSRGFRGPSLRLDSRFKIQAN